MVLSFVALIAVSQAPKTFEELELAKLIAFHAVKALHMEVEATVVSDTNPSTMHITTYIDGKRAHMTFVVPNQMTMERIDDGTLTWDIRHDQRAYQVRADSSAPQFDARASLLRAQPNSFSVNFVGLLPLQFASDPPPVLQQTELVHEGGQTLRKVVAVATSRKGLHMTVTQWFLPDRWIVSRFEISGESEKGPIKVVARATTIDFQTPDAKQFVLDPAKVAGYEKVAADRPPR